MFIRQSITFIVAAYVSMFMLTLGPWVGIPALLFFFGFMCPRYWRQLTIRNTEVLRERRKQAMEAQVIFGKLDVGLQQEVIDKMRRDGRL